MNSIFAGIYSSPQRRGQISWSGIRMQVKLCRMSDRENFLPERGKMICAYHDESHVTVYQAFSERIARYAVERQHFGDGFSLDRMSWIKPSFLWMMHRSKWGTDVGQARVLAIRMPRSFFDSMLQCAVPTSFLQPAVKDHAQWKQGGDASDVLFQWDPDRDISGQPLARCCIQVGLRGNFLREYAMALPKQIEDITEFAHELHVQSQLLPADQILLPEEGVYPVGSPMIALQLGLESPDNECIMRELQQKDDEAYPTAGNIDTLPEDRLSEEAVMKHWTPASARFACTDTGTVEPLNAFLRKVRAVRYGYEDNMTYLEWRNWLPADFVACFHTWNSLADAQAWRAYYYAVPYTEREELAQEYIGFREFLDSLLSGDIVPSHCCIQDDGVFALHFRCDIEPPLFASSLIHLLDFWPSCSFVDFVWSTKPWPCLSHLRRYLGFGLKRPNQ